VRLTVYRFPTSINSIEVIKQLHDADIFVVINNQFGVIIEDKTFTSEHSEQLRKYVTLIKNDPKYKHLELIPIYFKIGNQSNLTEVVNAGYHLFDRKDFLTILKTVVQAGTANDILLDYYWYLKNIDQQFEAYKTRPTKEWDWSAWQGFFTDIHEDR
jgi:hypothetical protein